MPAESAVALTRKPAPSLCMLTVEVPALKNCQRTEKTYFCVGNPYERAGAMIRDGGREAIVEFCSWARDSRCNTTELNAIAVVTIRIVVTETTKL